MKDLMSILEDVAHNVVIEVNGAELLKFANALISKARTELDNTAILSRTEKYLSRDEVMEMFGVCSTTLWN